MANPQQVDVQELVRRLEALETERAILRTLYRYGHSIDYGLEQEWVDCFTEDGVFDVRRRVGPASARYEGRAPLWRPLLPSIRERPAGITSTC
jgi:hypothetical protein